MPKLAKRSAEHLDLDDEPTIATTPVHANGNNAQRARTGSRHHPSEYKPGAVMKVKLHNFMTYSDVEMEPGPRLNVILGPNGTGKSSFVCALAMGLAAPTKILGRADKVAEFVKRGEEKGWCEITLRSNDIERPLKVRRELKRSDGTSQYKLNGVPVGQDRVKTEIKKLGCQLDNLCQFLPQDRVVAFAQLKPTQLLTETQKAIGDGKLDEEHKDLIKSKNDIADLERDVAAKNARIEKLNKEVEMMERDVTRFNEREELRARVDEYGKKRLWLDFHNKKANWKAAQDKLKELMAEIKKLEEDSNEHKAPLDKAIAANENAKKKHKEASRNLIVALKEMKKKLREVDALEDDHQGKSESLHKYEKEAKEKGKKIRERELAIAEIEKDIAAMVEPADNAAEIAKTRQESTALNKGCLALETNKDNLRRDALRHGENLGNMQRRLDNFRSERRRGLMTLRNNGNNRIIEADEELQKMQHDGLFHKPVLGPILTLIKCDNMNHRKYLEASIGRKWISAYITQDDRDRGKLQQWTKKWGTNAVNMSSVNYQDRVIDERTKSLGITHTLDQCFEAEPVVKAVLCDLSQLQRTFVIDPKAPQKAVDKAVEEVNGSLFYTPATKYARIVSKYGTREKTIDTSPVYDSRLFSSSSSATDEDDLKKEIQIVTAQKAACDDEIRQISSQLGDKMAKMQALTKRANLLAAAKANFKRDLNAMESKLVAKRRALEAVRSNDSAVQVEKLKKEIDLILAKRSKAACAHADAVTAMCKARAAETAALLTQKQAEAAHKYFKELYKAETEQIEFLNGEKEELEEDVRKTRDIAREAKREATNNAPIEGSEEAEALKAKFYDMPEQIDPYPNPVERPAAGQEGHDEWQEILPGIDECIRTFEEEADAIMCPNDMVLQEFRNKQDERNRLRAVLEESGGSLEEKQRKIEEKKQAWLGALRPLIDRINDNFKTNFASIGCAGEVKLHDAGEAFDQWELQIWVKFRASTDMHILDAHRQSGGERSVSTMLYLISLQELTSAPFRVVDEINQGMDPINERKIFKRMTKAASSSEATQTFLLTPKLLNNLQYTEDCTVLCIFNGPWIAEMAKRWQEMQRALQPGGPNTP